MSDVILVKFVSAICRRIYRREVQILVTEAIAIIFVCVQDEKKPLNLSQSQTLFNLPAFPHPTINGTFLTFPDCIPDTGGKSLAGCTLSLWSPKVVYTLIHIFSIWMYII